MNSIVEFRQFGEAAKLYAEHADVVDAIRKAFLADLSDFLNTLRERTESLVSHTVHESRNDKEAIRRWWLADSEESQHRDHLYVWIRSNSPSIVRTGVLEVSASAWAVFKPFRHLIVGIKDNLQLPASCKIKSGLEGSYFTVAISFGEQDPIGDVAGPIATILTTLFDLEQSFPAPPR